MDILAALNLAASPDAPASMQIDIAGLAVEGSVLHGTRKALRLGIVGDEGTHIAVRTFRLQGEKRFLHAVTDWLEELIR